MCMMLYGVQARLVGLCKNAGDDVDDEDLILGKRGGLRMRNCLSGANVSAKAWGHATQGVQSTQQPALKAEI